MHINLFNILKSPKRNNKSGLTLLEMLIYVSISSGVIIVILSLVAALLRSSNTSNSTAEVRQNAAAIHQAITQKVNASDGLGAAYDAWVSFSSAGASGSLMIAKYVGTGGTGCTGGNTAWFCYNIDLTANVDEYSSIAFDTSGNPWIAYYEGATGSCDNSPTTECSLHIAKYVRTNGTGCQAADWSCEIVDDPISTGNVGQYVSLGISNTNIPWISYKDIANGGILKVANYVGSGGTGCTGNTAWKCTTVDDPASSEVGSYSAIAFDLSNKPWVSYYDFSNASLDVANYVGSGGNCDAVGAGSDAWNCVRVDDPANDLGYYSSIAFDSFGKAWVSYADIDVSGVKAANYVGSGGNCDAQGSGSDAWDCTMVQDVANNVGLDVSMAFDSAGKAWVSHFDSTSELLWVNNYVGSGGNCDASGTGSDAWNCTVVDDDPANGVGQYTSITTNSSGNAWVTYKDVTANSLKAAAYVGSGGNCDAQGSGSDAWDCSTIHDPATSVGDFNDVAFYKPPITTGDFVDLTTSGTNARLAPHNFTTQSVTDPCTDTTWNCYAIDTANDYGQFSDVAIDRSGNPWISFYDVNSTALRVAQYIGSGGTGCGDSRWTCTTVDNTGTATGDYTSIAFDLSGNPWVSYRDITSTSLKVASKGGVTGGAACTDTAWNCTTVDNTGTSTGQYTSIAFDNSGRPWVSFYDVTATSQKVASKGGVTGGAACTDTAWNCTTVDNTSTSTGQYNSIAFDLSGNPWVSYYDSTAGNLALRVASKGGTTGGAACTDAAWNCTTVDNTGTDTGQYTSITFDLSGNAWVSYYDLTNTSLKVANYVASGGNCTSGAWNCTTVDNLGTSTGQHTSIAFDPEGNVWVSYQDVAATSLKIANYVGLNGNCTSAAWNCITIDNTGTATGQYTSIAFDPTGNAWINFYDTTGGNLRIANTGKTIAGGFLSSVENPCSANSSWSCSKVETGSGSENQMVIDGSGNPWIVSQEGIDTALRSIRYVGSGGTGCAGGNTAWTCTDIDDSLTEDVGYAIGLAIDSSGVPWVSYRNEQQQSLNVAKYVGSGGTGCTGSTAWSCTVVENTANDLAGVTAITVDLSGNGWVAYHDATTGNLKMANYVGSGGTGCTSAAWTCAILETGDYFGESGISMDVDSSGNVWVSYTVGTNTSIKVAKYVGSGGTGCNSTSWTCTIVEDTTNNFGTPSLSFDPSGTAWMAYTDSTLLSLKVAKYVGSGGTGCTGGSSEWTCVTLEDTADWLASSKSIAFDSAGNPWIAYQHYTINALKIAKYVGAGGTGCTSTSSWTCEYIEEKTDGWYGFGLSMAFDPAGNAWISYQDLWDTQPLKVANMGQPVTSKNVYITKCVGEFYYFKQIDNPAPTKDAIRYCFKVNYNTGGDPTKAFSQEIRSTVTSR